MVDEILYTPKQLSNILGVTKDTLVRWEREGKLKAERTEGGHRRYLWRKRDEQSGERRRVIYARVSSYKQQGDLERQVAALQKEFPNHQVVKDIGSGINFKRKGLLDLLEAVIAGNVQQVVVAHKDRLARFAFEVFELIFQRFGTTLTVLEDSHIKEPAGELADDLMSIITVFTARYHGSRSYKDLQKNPLLPHARPGKASKPMRRRIKVLLQPSRQHSELAGEEDLVPRKAATIGHAK